MLVFWGLFPYKYSTSISAWSQSYAQQHHHMAHTAASHLATKLGEGRGEGTVEPEGLLILAHLSLFLIQLIKALIRLTLTPSGNDECAAEEAEAMSSVYCMCSRGWRWQTEEEAGGWRSGLRGRRGGERQGKVYLCSIFPPQAYSECYL